MQITCTAAFLAKLATTVFLSGLTAGVLLSAWLT